MTSLEADLSVGLDPGKRSPAHYFTDGSHSKIPIKISEVRRVYLEGQYVNNKVSRQSLMTLSFFAGLHTAPYFFAGAKVYILKPEQWREAILERSKNAPKEVFHNRCLRDKVLPPEIYEYGPDLTDAYLILKAGERLRALNMLPKELKWIY